ncbi:gibberellin 2-beta-dioxygenase 8-like isoform X2 [Prosopis cineraria]|uniref:gibberellin 2-beta-dioxygenase 8-like isoform X2 n=1 Tax=Prosopis cineraria TaxID=364024 RepID=UPI00240F4724|nr:gibberellin 2-beta-dioxygenase 8-like isoform X2 [Prosopis cineraria]
MDYDPPFLETYKAFLQNPHSEDTNTNYPSVVDSWEPPIIDFAKLALDQDSRPEERDRMIEATTKWGLFQIVNHEISQELLHSMMLEQMKLFHQPFVDKSPLRTYKWGNPFATNLSQLSWSEAFHICLTDISRMVENQNLSVEAFATKATALVESIVEILAHRVNIRSRYFRDNCLPNSTFVRLNRYPQCPISSKVFGLMPHSDSSFLTIVYQDKVGGLQVMKDAKWVGVNPNPNALLVIIGDLFQALSNGVYRSIKHRVVAAERIERFSAAYFFCPSDDTVIQSSENNNKPAMYRKFTFREYRVQTGKDVKQIGDKVGLSRFLA